MFLSSEDQIRRDLAANKFDWDHPAHLQHQNPRSVDKVKVAASAMEAAEGAAGIAIITEWDEFKALDWQKVYDGMQKPAFVFDGRNILNPEMLRKIGFVVYSIGKPLDPFVKGLSVNV